ncbi:unnamed protein product [Leuciscus chuanchicus]
MAHAKLCRKRLTQPEPMRRHIYNIYTFDTFAPSTAILLPSRRCDDFQGPIPRLHQRPLSSETRREPDIQESVCQREALKERTREAEEKNMEEIRIVSSIWKHNERKSKTGLVFWTEEELKKEGVASNGKEAYGKRWTLGNEKNEGGVDKALCAKRKLCESETPSWKAKGGKAFSCLNTTGFKRTAAAHESESLQYTSSQTHSHRVTDARKREDKEKLQNKQGGEEK